VLRITKTASDNETVVKLEGRLAGPWVDELRKTVSLTDSWGQLKIDVSGLTFAEDEGEKALAWLHSIGARFFGEGPFPHYLFERLNIPLAEHRASTSLAEMPNSAGMEFSQNRLERRQRLRKERATGGSHRVGSDVNE
jgi:hypothetical protein